MRDLVFLVELALESLEGIHSFHFVFPTQGDAIEKLAYPVDGDIIVFFERLFEMLGVLDALIFDTEIVYD